MTGTLDIRIKWLIVVAALGYVVWLLGPALTPFVIAALLAYLFDPLVDRLERWHMSRTFAVTLVFFVLTVVIVAVLIVLVPFIERQIKNFIDQLPRWIAWFQSSAAPWLEAHLGVSVETLDTQQIATVLQDHWKEAGGFAAVAVAKVSKSSLVLLSWIAHVVIVPVATFYLLRDWHALVESVHGLVPRKIEPTVTQLARESDDVLGAFLRGQLSVMIVLGAFYAIALKLVGIDVGPLIGMIAGLISFVPYLGAIVGIAAGLLAALVQYQDWLHVLLVAGVFVVGHLIEGYVLVPRLIGGKIGLHPVAVIFAILAGGELFGFIGVLLALPVASVAIVLLRYAHRRYKQSALYTGEVAAREAHAAAAHAAIASSEAEIASAQASAAATDAMAQPPESPPPR